MNTKEWKSRLAERIDLTTKLIHLTKGPEDLGDKGNVISILLKILENKMLIGSTTDSGFICGDERAVCFQDTPIYSLTQNAYYEQKQRYSGKDTKVRYLGWGIVFQKSNVFSKGGRPVIYDIKAEAKKYLPNTEWWRIVNLDLNNAEALIDWTHEREWRIKGDFEFELSDVTILVPCEEALKYFLRSYKEKFNTEAFNDLKGVVSLGDIFY